MRPGARAQAAIEILDALDEAAAPADRLLSGWFRRRRYVGAKDRRAILDHVYGVLRRRAPLDWWLVRAGLEGPPDGRARMLAAAAFDGALDLFDGDRYGPPPLDAAERRTAEALAGQRLEHGEQPDWVRGNLPEWLAPRLRAAFGEGMLAEARALNVEAPVDLRVNTLKADRAAARAALAAEGVEAERTPRSPLGLRLAGRRTLPNVMAFRDGLVEVQDEGSQLAALLVDARPGQAVCDYCAGAGGKTLALAAAMENRGRLVACDIDAARLSPMRARLARAGATVVERCVLGGPQAALAPASFDRVLVDAPCSGSGAWRRNPDARWRLTPEALAQWCATQRDVLRAAAALVCPGGRLVYVTCSVLPEENEMQVQAFLAEEAAFAAVPAGAVWPPTAGDCPAGGSFLLLTPARHGTDGFFVAVLERRR